MMTAAPSSSDSERIRSRTSVDEWLSRFPVGSSARMMDGRATSARATATRCICPPDSSAGRCRARSPSPTRCSSSSARASADRAGIPSSTSGNDTFSTAVSIGTKLKNWNTNPRLRRRNAARAPALIAHTSWPSTATVPVSGASSPPAICRRVDLPAPDGPVTTTNSPASKVKSKSTSTCTCSSPLRYVLTTPSSCSTGVIGSPRYPRRPAGTGSATGVRCECSARCAGR